MSLMSFFRSLFGTKPSDAVPVVATVAPTRKPRQGAGQWVKRALKDFDGSKTVVVKVPAGVNIIHAQSSIGVHMKKHFGAGSYRTRMFHSSHTIHVSLK